MASKTSKELAFLLTGKDVSASKAMKGVGGEMKKLGGIAGKAGTNVARNLERGVLLGATAAVGAIGYAVKAATDFETSSASIRKTVDGNVDAIIASNRKLATTTGFDVNELNEISATAGALGVAKDDIDDFTESVALLSITADDVPTDVGATALGHLRTTLNLTGEDFRELTDEVVYLGANGASTEGQILAMAEGIAGAAGIVDASKEDVLAWASAVSSTGEEAEAGGSSIQRFWLESFKSVHEGGKELALMSKISGTTAAQFEKDFGEDATGTLAVFIDKLGDLDEATQLATLEDLGFTDIRIQRSLLKLLANTDNLTQSLEDVHDAAGAAGEEAEIRFKTTAKQIDILRANVYDAAISIGSELLPVINELAQEGVSWLQGHQPEIRAFAKDLSSGIKGAVAWARELDWQAITGAIKAGAGFASGIVQAFTSAPPWLQEFLAVGFVANKFTGGAIGDVVGELGKGLIKGVLGMNAGIVNINAAAVRGPGLGGGLPGAVPMAGMNGVSRLALGGAGALGVLGGSWMLDQAVQNGPTPLGIGAGIGGGAATIGGAAAIGGAVGLAPLGAVIGAALAVEMTRQGVSAKSTAQSEEIGIALAESLAGPNSVADLTTKLGAIDTGIQQIQSNPLLALVQGEALTNLQGMRADVAEQLTHARAMEELARGGLSIEDRDERIAPAMTGKEIDDLYVPIQDGATKTVAAVDRAEDATERNRLTLSGNLRQVDASTRSVYGGTREIVAAIQNLSLPGTVVNVTVGAGQVTKAQTEEKRAGNSGRLHAQ